MILDHSRVICMATIPSTDERAAFWAESFGGHRVPVKAAIPQIVIFPNGQKVQCYLVDFEVAGPSLMELVIVSAMRRGAEEGVIRMLREGIHPVVANGVTVVRGPLAIWLRKL